MVERVRYAGDNADAHPVPPSVLPDVHPGRRLQGAYLARSSGRRCLRCGAAVTSVDTHYSAARWKLLDCIQHESRAVTPRVIFASRREGLACREVLHADLDLIPEGFGVTDSSIPLEPRAVKLAGHAPTSLGHSRPRSVASTRLEHRMLSLLACA